MLADMTARNARAVGSSGVQELAALAVRALKRELATYPKPGLVSHLDNGSHDDMDATLLNRSADTLEPFFADLALAGAGDLPMNRLRAIGLRAEQAMLAQTGGVNTHRGAIFGLGLLCAAAGFRAARQATSPLGTIVARRWGPAILAGPTDANSHGAQVARRHGVSGARAEAAAGFPAVYEWGLPTLKAAQGLHPGNAEAVRVQLCMALIAKVEDSNLVYRGGLDGLAFAQTAARRFLTDGGIARPDWRDRAEAVHHSFVARRLSPGGSADLLAMTLFAESLGDG
jgi:triphosphoribosyl-dephospho-CoA synthase